MVLRGIITFTFMVKNCLLLFFVFCSLITYSQDWQAVHIGWRYNYRLDQGNTVAATIWVDSAKVVSGDSVFYLNRIVSHCDTCHATLGGANPCDSCYELINQPQFLQGKITALANGDFYFSDTSHIALHPNDSLAWLFDTTANITAIVSNTHYESVFNNADSVRVILLSSGDTIKVSKQHGILLFPRKYGQNSYYKLVGIEGPNLGEKVPGFWDFFDFNVGDVFRYEDYFANWGWGTQSHSFDQYSITSKSVFFPDSIVYGISGFTTNYNSMTTNSYSATMSYVDSSNHFTNLFNHELIDGRYVPNAQMILFDKMAFDYDSVGYFEKYFGGELDPLSPFAIGTNMLLVDSNQLDIYNFGIFDQISLRYKAGLGMTDYVYHVFEVGGSHILIAFCKNGDTTGVLMKTPQLEDENSFTLYPNPVIKTLQVKFKNSGERKIQIKDILGKIIFEQLNPPLQSEIDLSNVSSGVYIVSVLSNGAINNRKIVVSKK